jgi:hypothetical protein
VIAARFVQRLALSSILAASAPAWAGPPAAEPAGGDDRAAHLLQAGNRAFKEGKFAEAEDAYREAFSLKRGYDIAGNLGAAELAQGKLRACAEHLAYTLRLFPVTGEPALRSQMARAHEQCRTGVAAVQVDAGLPRGAGILVDGAAAGEAPLLDEIYIDPGEHVLEARLDGYTGEPVRVKLAPGDVVALTLPLVPLPPKERTVVRIVPARRRSLLPALGLGLGALAGVAAGAALLGASAGKRSEIGTLQGQILGSRGSCVPGGANYNAARCPSLLGAARAEDTLNDAAGVAFVAGGAAAVAAAGWLLWPQRPSPSGPDVRVIPVVSAGGAAVFLSGSF